MVLTYAFRVGQTQSMYGISVTLQGFSTEENYAFVNVNGVQYKVFGDVWQLAGGLKIFVTMLDDPSQTAQITAESISVSGTETGTGTTTTITTVQPQQPSSDTGLILGVLFAAAIAVVLLGKEK